MPGSGIARQYRTKMRWRTKTSVGEERPKWSRCCGTASISSPAVWTRNTLPALVRVRYAGTGGTTSLLRNRTTTTTTIIPKPEVTRRPHREADVTKITRTIFTAPAITGND